MSHATTLENSSDDSTLQNYQLYELIELGENPVSVSQMRSYLGLGSNNCFDPILKDLIDSCTTWGESYTGREFRANQYTLLIDSFADRISLRKNPIGTIDSVKYILSNVLTTVDAATYFLKKGVHLSEILLAEDKSWPTDADNREQVVEIAFTTKAVDAAKLSKVKTAIHRHVAFMFDNRGDCGDCGACAGKDAANVEGIYNQLRIARI